MLVDPSSILSSLAGSVQAFLAEASEKMQKYDWTGAAELYSQALGSRDLDSNTSEYLRLTETLADCYYKAAFQAKDHREFVRIMTQARDAYDKSAIASAKTGDDISSRRMKAKKTFTEYWVSPDAPTMLNHIRDCLTMSAETLTVAKVNGDEEKILYALKDELTYLAELPLIFEDHRVANERFHRATSATEATIRGFEESGRDTDLLECLHMAITFYAFFYVPVEEFKRLEQKFDEMAAKMERVSNRLGTAYAKSLRNDALAAIAFRSQGNPAKALKLYEETVQPATETGDTLLIGEVHAANPAMACWIDLPDDAEQARELLEKGIRHSPESIRNFEVSARPQWLSWAYSWWAESYINLARFVETDVEAKKAQVMKALEIAQMGAKYDSKENWTWCTHSLSKCLYLLATWSRDVSEKKRLLAEALPLREHEVRQIEITFPDSFDEAVMYNYLALVKSELSILEQNPANKALLLQSAISDMAKCLEAAVKWPTSERMVALARFHEQYADFLLQLYNLTHDEKNGVQSIEALERAADYLDKAGHYGSEAGVRWKIGNAYELLGEYDKSSHAFKTAAGKYEEASKKHSGTANMFSELASYMRAWTSIQEARLHHGEDQYSSAAENYLNAASILDLTKRWRHIAGHYRACASLEEGEAQSREENHQESSRSFQSALQVFQENHKQLGKMLNENPTAEDKVELENWLKITKGRQEYSQGRLDLEEAVVLDMKGDEEGSGRKFGSASEIFAELAEKSSVQQSKRELETLAYMSDAWSKMKLAEVKASPELYSQASKSFTKVQETTDSNRYRLLALANASMCQALESGTRFRRTRDSQLYSEIKKSLETAADYYHRGGLSKAAEWIHATQRLFDALAYLTGAEAEMDSKKKTELYHLAEKHLQLAAKLYEKAGYLSKRNEALKHLERAKEEKELLLTPLGALADSPAIAGVSVAPVSLIRDQAVGLEKFDVAHVVGNIGLPANECGVGSDLTVELELANVGKTSATLIKLENIAAPGLDINKQTSPNRYEDNYLDLRGKRLDYMKSHEVKVSLKARHKGTYELRPRILFVDEQGNYKSYQFEPATVTVRELGIGGWLKGPK
jgi:tetratricopeptide (TPR) repeat protein